MLKRFLPKKDVSLWKKIGFWIVTVIVGIGAFGLIMSAITIVVLSIGLPDVTKLENLNPPESTQIFDRDNKLIYTIHGEENRDQVDIKEISPYVVEATVAIEDSDFWKHEGFDLMAIGRAALYEVFGIGNPRGGSTITQQYIKNSFLSSERSYVRKAKELILALRLERAFEKEEIIELYLNRIPYGNNAYGIQKAAEVYFDKDAKDLTLGESAILASLPQAPSRYNPYGDNRYSHLLKEFTAEELEDRDIESESDLEVEEYARGVIGKHVDLGNGEKIYIPGRSDLVLKSMHKLEYITSEEWQAALNEIQSIEFNSDRSSFNHPHFVLYIKEQLEEKYGKDVVEQGGLKVYTTLDSDLQEYAEKVALERGETNEKNYQVNNNAILTIDAKTGHILAMVGSRQYDMEEIDGNVNVVFRPRQPGSSFKPIVYAQAFYNGYGPGSVIYDVPTRIGSDRPSNYDGSWLGQTTIRKALGKSRNIPAIKAYYLAGEQDPIINLAEKMGITTLKKSHSYGYPLALGAGEISLSEMVGAYSVFANNGKKVEMTGILKVENANGDVLEEWQPKEWPEVLDPQIAYLINDILSDQNASVGPRIFIKGHHNAAKTGTSTKENKKDAAGAVRPSDGWTIGYTPSIVTGVWIGNTDGTGLGYNADGYNAAALIFQDVMTKALEDVPSEPFEKPEGIKQVKISSASGKLPGPNTPADFIISEIFASFAVPTEQENLFFEVEIDKISGLLATEFTPEGAVEKVTYQNFEDIADMFNWKQEVINYYGGKTSEEGGDEKNGIRVGLPPKEYDNVHNAQTAANAPTIIITNPSTQGDLPVGNNEIQVDIKAVHGVEIVEFYLDDERKFFTTSAPYNGFINISRFLPPGSRHLIVAKIVDSLGYTSQSAIEIKVARKEEETPDAEKEDES